MTLFIGYYDMEDDIFQAFRIKDVRQRRKLLRFDKNNCKMIGRFWMENQVFPDLVVILDLLT